MMQIVIDIDLDTYKKACERTEFSTLLLGYKLIEAVQNGTPLPKIGKWIKTYEPNDAEPCILWMCSKCQNAERGRRSKYCPNCGSYNGDEEI